jgi:hypothetical protein
MKKTEVLRRMQRLLGGSTLIVQDTVTIGRQIKRRIWKKSQASKKRQAFRGLSQRSRRYAKQVGLRKRILTRALRVVRQEATTKR